MQRQTEHRPSPRVSPLQTRSMGTGSGRTPPPCNITLPEMNRGLFMPSVALGLRLTDGLLREFDPEPEEPPPRCAAAAAAIKRMTTANRVLNRTNLSTMA